MTANKLNKEATEYVDKVYPLGNNDCRAIASYITALDSEIITYLEKKNNPNCKNRLFSKNDCKREAEVYWDVLTDRKSQLEAKFARENCAIQFSRQEQDEYLDTLDESLESTADSVAASQGWVQFAVYGAGISVVLLGTYLILRKKK